MNKHVFVLILIILISSCNKSEQAKSLGIVSSATPEATAAGEQVLKMGGNAIDAAIAVAFTLGVTEPAMTGLGAGIQILVSIPDQDPFMINGTTLSPKATPVNATREDILFHRRSTIPSFVKTLGFAFHKYGSNKIAWKDLLKPSIQYASNGFEMGRFRGQVYKRLENIILENQYNLDHFLINGKIPLQGEVLKQPVLANTLERLAQNGSDEFYKGEIAETIAQEMNENKGWLTIEDLNNFPEPIVSPAISTTYHNYSIFTTTPPCGGWVVLLALNLLEQIPTTNDMAQRNKDLIVALGLAHGKRNTNPIVNMLDYGNDVYDRISKESAYDLIKLEAQDAESNDRENSGETTHFSIVDSDGMLVSVTTSINAYFGSRAASKKLGFIYNSYMEDFVFEDSTHSYAVGPNKMAYSSMSPSIVIDENNQNVMAIGSPGSSRIISSVAQTIQYWIDIKTDINEAVYQPRIHAVGKRVYMEHEPTTSVGDWLRKRSYKIQTPSTDLNHNGLNPYFGGIHAVAFENGYWVGAADPRRDGTATLQVR